jgi:hypothetical protein
VVYIALILALFAGVFIFDLIPQIKTKDKVLNIIYIPVFLLTLIINILYGLHVKIPSPAGPIKELVDKLLGI